MKRLLMLHFLVAVLPLAAYGFGEICHDFNAVGFGSRNNIDVCVQVVSDAS